MNRVYIADINSLMTAEGKSQGHYVAIFQNYVDVLKDYADVIVAGGSVYQKHFSDRFFALPYNARFGMNRLLNKWQNLMNLRALFKQVGSDTVVFQSSSLLMVWLGTLLFAQKNCYVFIINYSADFGGRGSLLQKLIYNLARRKITGNICTSEAVGKALVRPYCVVPDYIYTGMARLPQTAADFKFDFAIVGIVNRSKGVLEAAKKIAQNKYTLFIGGRILDDSLRYELRKIAANRPNVILQ